MSKRITHHTSHTHTTHITHTHKHTNTHTHTHTTQYLFLLDNIFQKLPIWKSGGFSDTGIPSVSLITLP